MVVNGGCGVVQGRVACWCGEGRSVGVEGEVWWRLRRASEAAEWKSQDSEA